MGLYEMHCFSGMKYSTGPSSMRMIEESYQAQKIEVSYLWWDYIVQRLNNARLDLSCSSESPKLLP